MKNTRPVWRFVKNRLCGFVFVPLLFFSQRVFSTDFSDVYDFYKKGNYDTLVKVSRVALRREEVDYKILLLYTASEKDPEEIDKTLRSIYEKKESHPGIFYNSVFYFWNVVWYWETNHPESIGEKFLPKKVRLLYVMRRGYILTRVFYTKLEIFPKQNKFLLNLKNLEPSKNS